MNTFTPHSTKTPARRVVLVDLTATGQVATSDALGTRTSAAPALLGWRHVVAILQRLDAAGPHVRTLGSAVSLGVRPHNAGSALRNHVTRVADYLRGEGHVGLALLLDALLITREGLISIDRHSAPHLEMKVTA